MQWHKAAASWFGTAAQKNKAGAVYPKHCSSALMFGDCTPVCRVNFHTCKCSDTRLLSVVWHSSTEEQGRQFTLNPAAVHWCLVTASLYYQWHKAAVSWFGIAAQKNKAGSLP